MSRANRIALLAAAALILAAAGTVLATRAPDTADEPAHLASSHEPEPQTEDADEPPEADALERAASRLGVEQQVLADLATEYGFGGAVRIVAWANDPEANTTIQAIRDMRASGGPEGTPMGWGQIARRLGVHPGIGSIMGNGGGHGRDNAPGQQDRGEEDDSGG